MDKFSGLSFEKRCEHAIEMLHGCSNDIDEIRNASLLKLEEMRKRIKPAPDDPEELKTLIDGWVAEDSKMLLAASETMSSIIWKATEKICRDLYGDDATNFALIAVERNKANNKRS